MPAPAFPEPGGDASARLAAGALHDDDAHVWMAEPDLDDARTLSRAAHHLGPDERRRAARFMFERDPGLYVFAHALVRVTLARYLRVDPAAVRFAVAPRGRPELARRDGERPPLRFNLSHTHGLAACIVTRAMDCGVDVERFAGDARVDGVARTVLAPSEAEGWEALTTERRRARFLELWTLKEAYIKARGLGLALPLREIAFSWSGGQPVCSLGPGVADDAATWRFWSGRVTPQHGAAIALRTGGVPATLSIFRLASNLRSFESVSRAGLAATPT